MQLLDRVCAQVQLLFQGLSLCPLFFTSFARAEGVGWDMNCRQVVSLQLPSWLVGRLEKFSCKEILKLRAGACSFQKSPLLSFLYLWQFSGSVVVHPRKATAAMSFSHSKAGMSWDRFGTLYTVGELLGVGGNGRVYAGTRTLDGLPVALKRVERLSPSLLCREVNFLQKVRHLSGVAKLVDWHIVDGTLLIVIDRTLTTVGCSDRLQFVASKNCLSEEEARRVFNQVALTAQQLAQEGVLHRDIKAENILVNRATLACWLLDFGSATEAGKALYTDFNGTVSSAPPEWFVHRKYGGESLTVWSLGVLLYLMVYGKRPFKRRDHLRQASVTFGEERSGQTCSAQLKSLVLACLASNPEERISLAAVLEHPWLQGRATSEAGEQGPGGCQLPTPGEGPGVTTCSPDIWEPAFPHLESREARLETFLTWPISLHPRGEGLCRAGFYYSGEAISSGPRYRRCIDLYF